LTTKRSSYVSQILTKYFKRFEELTQTQYLEIIQSPVLLGDKSSNKHHWRVTGGLCQ
jgi:hypothetical protein